MVRVIKALRVGPLRASSLQLARTTCWQPKTSPEKVLMFNPMPLMSVAGTHMRLSRQNDTVLSLGAVELAPCLAPQAVGRRRGVHLM